MWLQLMLPLTLLVVGHVLLVTKRFMVTERGKEFDAPIRRERAHARLAFQGQGQSTWPFDYFRKVPLDDTVMDTLQPRARLLRKRHFTRPRLCSVTCGYNPKFRDLEASFSRAKHMSETVISV